MDRTLREIAAQLPELDQIEALPDELWDRLRPVSVGRPDLPLAEAAHRLRIIAARLG